MSEVKKYPASKNFDIREFVPKMIWDKWGVSSTWFINPKQVQAAEFVKQFFTKYYKDKYGNDKVKTVLAVINNWHTGGDKHWRAVRLPQSKEYREQSQHSFVNALDIELIIVFYDGSRNEADYKEVHEAIMLNQAEFIANGITSIESIEFATGWLHIDFRWILNQKNILIIKPSKP